MKLVKALGIIALFFILLGALGWQFFLREQVEYARIAAAYGAKMVCSCRFVAERPMESCLGDFTSDFSMVSFHETAGSVRAEVLGGLVRAEAKQTGPDAGCRLVTS